MRSASSEPTSKTFRLTNGLNMKLGVPEKSSSSTASGLIGNSASVDCSGRRMRSEKAGRDRLGQIQKLSAMAICETLTAELVTNKFSKEKGKVPVRIGYL